MVGGGRRGRTGTSSSRSRSLRDRRGQCNRKQRGRGSGGRSGARHGAGRAGRQATHRGTGRFGSTADVSLYVETICECVAK